jgi:ammonia channel protein AmtB
LFKNTIDHALGSIAWFCVGWSFFIGDYPFISGDDVTWFYHNEFEFARIFQQYGFAVTASTIVSGALLSRCRLRVYAVFSFLLG